MKLVSGRVGQTVPNQQIAHHSGSRYALPSAFHPYSSIFPFTLVLCVWRPRGGRQAYGK